MLISTLFPPRSDNQTQTSAICHHISAFLQELTETNNTELASLNLASDDYGGDGIFLQYDETFDTETSPTMDVQEIIQDIGGSEKSTRLQQ